MTTKTDDRAEWIHRCAQRYIERTGVDADTAHEFAEACWGSYQPEGYTPEDAADEDMSYWEES